MNYHSPPLPAGWNRGGRTLSRITVSYRYDSHSFQAILIEVDRGGLVSVIGIAAGTGQPLLLADGDTFTMAATAVVRILDRGQIKP